MGKNGSSLKQQPGARSGRKARRSGLEQQQVQAQATAAQVLKDAQRIVSAANKTERRKRKVKARRARERGSSEEEDFELLPAQLHSSEQRQEVSEQGEYMGEAGDALGGEQQAGSNSMGESSEGSFLNSEYE